MVRALVPSSLKLADNNQCFINQYVVDTTDQTSGFEAYSLTYAGADLSGLDTPDGAIPGRWWTHYFNSNADMRAYASQRGVPAEPGETKLEISDGILTATTSADGTPVIRTTVRVGDEIAVTGRGQLRYITEVSGRLTSGLYPFNAGLVQPWEVTNFEFLEPDHPVSALRPADPLQVTWGFYSPNALLLPRRRGAARGVGRRTAPAVPGRDQRRLTLSDVRAAARSPEPAAGVACDERRRARGRPGETPFARSGVRR